MLKIGRYLFYKSMRVDIISIKFIEEDVYCFFKPDFLPKGWWVSSNQLKFFLEKDYLIYVEPYLPLEPKKYLLSFNFE